MFDPIALERSLREHEDDDILNAKCSVDLLRDVTSDHVVLASVLLPGVSPFSYEFEFNQLLPDGSADLNAFVVPADKVLVVTDVSVTTIEANSQFVFRISARQNRWFRLKFTLY